MLGQRRRRCANIERVVTRGLVGNGQVFDWGAANKYTADPVTVLE